MVHDGLAARAGKARDHIDPAKSELAKDPPRRRIVVSVSGPESQHPSVFARETHDGVRGLEGVAPPPLGAVEPIAQTSPVEVDNANDPSFEFNRNDRLAPLATHACGQRTIGETHIRRVETTPCEACASPPNRFESQTPNRRPRRAWAEGADGRSSVGGDRLLPIAIRPYLGRISRTGAAQSRPTS